VAPVVDFDAVFIADYHKPVGLIAPALAFEDVFVGNDERAFRQFKQTTGRTTARRVQLLGTNGFNDASLPARGGKYVQGALFVDGFNPNDGRPETAAFLKAFAAATGARAELREAQAYDAGRMLGQVFASNPHTRAEFKDRLGAIKDFPGITGSSSFDAQGSAITPLHVFTIKHDQIVPAVLERRTGG
jgi:ABC-type branched-subunit amino acid transport system substrate-binding protein